jgi:hypothetical protein
MNPKIVRRLILIAALVVFAQVVAYALYVLSVNKRANDSRDSMNSSSAPAPAQRPPK